MKGEHMGSTRKQKEHLLVGSWVNGEENETDVEYIVSRQGVGFKVCAIDRFDGEKGEVHDVKYDKITETLFFNVHWASTGRLLKIRMTALSQNRIDFTYSFTQQQMWFRKNIAVNGGKKLPKSFVGAGTSLGIKKPVSPARIPKSEWNGLD